MALRPWEAQKIFGTTTNEVKAPVAIVVVPKKESFTISWQKRLGLVDGFIILVGNSPNELRDRQAIPSEQRTDYTAEVGFLDNGKEYFTTVVAVRGGTRSEITELWKVIPNFPGRCRPAEKVDISNISPYPHPPTTDIQPLVEPPTVQPAREESVQSQVANAGAAEQPRRRPEDVAAICGGCAGDVMLDTNLHLFVCSGCGTRYVQRVADGKFLPVGILANGICECCDPRRPLIQPSGESFKKCSQSGEKYVELSGNGLKRVSQLDYGLCSCCRPPAALILNAQGQVVCSKIRENLYVREGNGFVQRLPEAPPSLLNDIDRALAQGSAGMMPNGVLITDNEGSPNRRRRRN